MQSTFVILQSFLAANPPEVRGRENDQEVLDDLIRRFQAGDLSDDEMLSLYRELRGNEYAIRKLASTLNGE
jgi:hypothetical protein